jgi:curli production assembly/transport component CsgF
MKSHTHFRNAFIALAILFSSSQLSAQDFVYRATNPAFGGEIFNYQWMLNSANAQNTLTAEEEDRFNPFERNTVDDFADNLKRQLLNQISRELIGDQLGEGLSEGSYTIGSFQIDVTPTGEGLSISILDTTTGDQTLVIVPYF